MNLQSILRTELHSRMKRNPNYSMRLFAKFLEMDPSLLSKFLNGKRNLSRKTKARIADKINLPVSIIENDSQSGDDQKILAYYSDIRYELILELMNLDEFRPNAEWVSEQLGIPLQTVTELLSDLQKMGALRIDENNVWTNLRTGEVGQSSGDQDQYIRKTYQKEIFDQAYKALDSVAYQNREHSAVMVATDAELIEEVKRRIAEFRVEMTELLKTSEKKNTVYQLSIACSPLNHRAI